MTNEEWAKRWRNLALLAALVGEHAQTHLAHEAMAPTLQHCPDSIKQHVAYLDVYGSSAADGTAIYERIELFDSAATKIWETPIPDNPDPDPITEAADATT